MGGDIRSGNGVGSPLKFELGERPVYSSPPIFREVVLLDACESTNRVKNCVIKEFFCSDTELFSRQERARYVISDFRQ